MTVSTMLSLLSEGFVTSLLIFALTLLFSMPLGLAVMFGRRSRLTPLRGFIKAYISIMRGTPLMLLLMVVYFGHNPPDHWYFGHFSPADQKSKGQGKNKGYKENLGGYRHSLCKLA